MIATCIRRQFQCDPAEFALLTIDEDFGDELLIFPNEDMTEAVIERGSFYVGNNIKIALHPYSPQLQMAEQGSKFMVYPFSIGIVMT